MSTADGVEEVESAENATLDELLAHANWEQKLADAEARVLRSQADLENFRKRVRREHEEERRYASLPLLRDLLPVLDNLERALEALPEGSESTGLRSGIDLVARQMREVLRRHECLPIEAVGQPFDPNWHEAIG
ncbi:MAG TPA: nucleotide exchange factor GrpE, partial [Pirellulaceae bacterium]